MGGDAIPDLVPVLETIMEARRRVPKSRSVLVGMTGIDGCGKGFVTARLVHGLLRLGVHAVGLNIDGWLNLPHVRFHRSSPAEHFYLHAIRFEKMFEQLVFPLRDRRSLEVEVDYAEETANRYRKHLHTFENVDVIVLEGIYLLKRAFQEYYDLAFWIDCSFETALERAIDRGQEGLPVAETVRAYRSIYFPAQEIHFERDDPRSAATGIVANDSRLAAAVSRA